MVQAVSATNTGEQVSGSGVQPLRVLVAASGTGGHLIPAMHIVKAIQAQSPGAVIEFIGAGRPLEEKLIVERGFVRHTVASAGIKRRHVVGLFQFLTRFPKAIFQILSLYKSFKPDVVVGVGGYVSVLPVVVARLRGIPSWIHEAERHPGLANKVLCYFADTMSTAFEETEARGRVKVVHTGHPVREELKGVDPKVIKGDAPKRLLILGGSQGARGLDEAVSHIAPLLAERQIEVVHQCRPDAMELVVNSYRANRVPAHVVDFIDDMAGAYQWSDVIISRAGASSVAEIAFVNRPAIFVPYPFQQGTHQSDNALTLVVKNKAIIVEEDKPGFGERLKDALGRLLTPQIFKEMKEAPRGTAHPDSARAIARGVIELSKSHKA
jgi:UDP-N-acetylglucosamine--N-acetylmuramyl-(pentapeptide) pyrophosphoryl-undecaprenol N-acetylglucosamine transferase